MPVYEYKCAKGHSYEKTEGFDAPVRQKCINCGAAARRQISMPAVIFKGSGFYSTDNRKGSPDGSPSTSDSSSESSAPSNGSSADSGTGSKTGSKAEASGTKSKAATAD
ncbi:MAG: hypothetical protein IH957_10195 [Chloroflexi bacterium]|nr:hypothetical protein [Chloroflexota bacterium]